MAMKLDKLRTDPRGGTIKTEYKVMYRLQSCPHVCRVSRDGYGQHDGRHFMIMELLGVNLAQMRSASPSGRFPGEVVKIIGRIVHNFTAGHERGVMKASNIIILLLTWLPANLTSTQNSLPVNWP
jgi:hypothetical protein